MIVEENVSCHLTVTVFRILTAFFVSWTKLNYSLDYQVVVVVLVRQYDELNFSILFFLELDKLLWPFHVLPTNCTKIRFTVIECTIMVYVTLLSSHRFIIQESLLLSVRYSTKYQTIKIPKNRNQLFAMTRTSFGILIGSAFVSIVVSTPIQHIGNPTPSSSPILHQECSNSAPHSIYFDKPIHSVPYDAVYDVKDSPSSLSTPQLYTSSRVDNPTKACPSSLVNPVKSNSSASPDNNIEPSIKSSPHCVYPGDLEQRIVMS